MNGLQPILFDNCKFDKNNYRIFQQSVQKNPSSMLGPSFREGRNEQGIIRTEIKWSYKKNVGEITLHLTYLKYSLSNCIFKTGINVINLYMVYKFLGLNCPATP